MRFRGPLVDSYPSAVALVLLALCPYLVLTTAALPIDPLVGKGAHVTATGLALTAGIANAFYSFGCVIAAQFAQKLRGRRLLVLYSAFFVVASVLAAWAPTPGVHIAGRIGQGFATGLMLIAAVPPLVLRWPPSKLPRTAIVMNMGIFGATALGPVVGGAVAGGGDWRLLFWIVAGLGALGLAFILLTYEDQEPMDPSAPWDPVGISLAGVGSGALFFAVSFVSAEPFLSLPVLLPFLVGTAALVAAILYEYFSKNPLMPLRGLAHTYPLAGILTAMVAGASSVALIQLAQTVLEQKGRSPLEAGMLFWPEFGAAVIAAFIFGRLFRTKYTPVLVITGLLTLAGGGALIVAAPNGPDALIAVGSALIGLGTAFSVAPALFVTGFSMPSKNLPRIFALIELLRGVAAFLAGPLLLHLAQTVAGGGADGLRVASWIAFGLPLVGAVVVVLVFVLGHGRLQEPNIEEWVDGEKPAIESHPVLAAARGVPRPAPRPRESVREHRPRTREPVG